MNNTFSYIIVGSGPSAVMAAQTLVEAGKEVAMLDIGHSDKVYAQLPEDKPFEDLRKNDKQQHRYLLGDDYEAIPWDEIEVGAQLSPSRKSMIRDVAEWLPLQSDNFVPMESMGKGGLGAGWGLGAYVYSAAELARCGLREEDMLPSYQKVADRIGISVGNDDVRPYILGGITGVQEPLQPDKAFQVVQKKYQKYREELNKQGVYYGAPSMAFLTQDLGKRKATKYNDMDFYTDHGQSAYRAQFTLEELESYSNFHYLPGNFVLSYKDEEQGVEVNCLRVDTRENVQFRAKKLILSAGALGNGRITLRSLEYLESLPVLSNPYAYTPCIHPRMLGKDLGKKTSMAQAMMVYDPDGTHSDLVSVALYSFSSSLMLFKIMKEAPLNFRDSRIFFQYLQSAFVIAGIHHPDQTIGLKAMRLIADDQSPTGDKLKVDFGMDATIEMQILEREKPVRAALRKLGIFPISRMAPAYGGSIHYAGTIPFAKEESLGTSAYNGRLHTTHNVYVADSSAFQFLPAKGITLSLMANADRVSRNILAHE